MMAKFIFKMESILSVKAEIGRTGESGVCCRWHELHRQKKKKLDDLNSVKTIFRNKLMTAGYVIY